MEFNAYASCTASCQPVIIFRVPVNQEIGVDKRVCVECLRPRHPGFFVGGDNRTKWSDVFRVSKNVKNHRYACAVIRAEARSLRQNTPVMLVINKIDKVKKEEILRFIDTYRKELDFAAIVPVSALKGENTDDLTDTIFTYLPEGPQYYDEDTVTDQPERQIAAEMIREKALRNLEEEIPHGVAVLIDRMKEREGGTLIDLDATIICEKESHKGIIIGKKGLMLKKIGTEARRDIEMMTGTKVNLKLWVKVKENWRDSDVMIRNYGYRDPEE